MNRTGLLLFLIPLVPLLGFGQHRIQNVAELKGYNSIPKETVFIHHNDNFFVSGEYLYYKMYCLNKENLALSEISKMGYVELLGNDGQPIFKHKITLNAGLGQGDFFIPTNLATGRYKLLGYTRWMLNDGARAFFTSDIVIVNPYQELPKISSTIPRDTLKLVKKDGAANQIDSRPDQTKSSLLEIELPQRIFGKRKPVRLKIKELISGSSMGHYSISVRKKNRTNLPNSRNTVDFISAMNPVKETNSIQINDTVFIPELRGELISGRIISKKDGSPIPFQNISLSIVGDNGLVRISSSGANGIVYFNLDKTNRNSKVLFEVLGDRKNEARFFLDSIPPINLNNQEFKEIVLSPELNNMILKKSVYGQIENAFFEQKPDTIVNGIDGTAPFQVDLQEVYNLDDYTRFNTLKETIVEIIDNVFIRNVKGKPILQVRGNDAFLVDSGDAPLVTVDNVLIQDFGELLEYNAREIDEIRISRHEHYLGPKHYQGIVAIDTKEGDYDSQMKTDNLSATEIAAPLPFKHYYFQSYVQFSTDDMKKIADFRHQLLWQPDFKLSPETTMEFFTSDNTGEYEIRLEGFTTLGEPISISESIRVE